jgi:predicted AlkP superfamily pyrophosphatase or phosphodiesterase
MPAATLLPDYEGGSLPNLMRSVADACGGPRLPYAPARDLQGDALADAKSIVLLVVDGLGHAHVLRGARDGFLRRHLKGAMTSVFPSTTAAAIPTFLTGLAPQQHGLTGWHMYFAEIDRILAVLPMAPRGGPALDVPAASLAQRLLSPAEIFGSPFNRHHSQGAIRAGFGGLAEMLERLAELSSALEPCYVHAYYPALDSTAHAFGIVSPQVTAVLVALEQGLEALAQRLQGSGTVLIVTADHGFIDAPARRLIELENHPELGAMLARPLCGERRVAYCYVRSQRRGDFECYVRERMGHAVELHDSGELVERGWFGPGEPHPQLLSRVGDYTLVMREDWTIKDWLPGEKRYRQIGVHGGISAAEMQIPLIVARL